METEYYTPPVEKHLPPPLLVSKETSRVASELGADENGRIELQIDRKVVISRLSKDVYADYRSGFRELYANAVTACLVARETFKANPSIHITLDPETRILEIEERDSIGISPATFKVYRVVGRSGNFEGTKLGQFGFGKLAWAKISDTVILRTKWRTPDGLSGAYALEGKGATDYFVLPEPRIEHFGTTLKMVLTKEVNVHSLYDYVLKCKFTGVPTYLHLTHGITFRREYSRESETIPAGDYKVSKSYNEDYLARKAKVEKDKTQVRTVREVKVAAEGFEAYIVLAVKKESWDREFSLTRNETHRYLLGMPVELSIDLPFSYSVINIADERKFQPTADKERLKDEAKEALEEKLKASIARELSFLHATTLDRYRALSEDEKDWFRNDDLWGYFPEPVARFARFITERFRPYRDHDERTIIHLIEEHGAANIVFEDGLAFVKARVERIKKHNPKAVIIKANGFAEVLRSCGFLSCKEYIQKHDLEKIRISLAHKVYGSHLSAVGWGGLSRPARQTEEADKVARTVVKTPGSVKDFVAIFSELHTSMKLVKDAPDLAGQGTPLNEFLEAARSKKLETSRGTMTIKALADSARNVSSGRNGGSTANIILIPYSDPSVARHLSDASKTLVLTGPDALFDVALYFRAHKKPYFVSYELGELPEKALPGYRSDYTGHWNWQVTDPEILMSVAHVNRVVKDSMLKQIFENAARGSKDPKEVAEMRRGLLRLAGVAE